MYKIILFEKSYRDDTIFCLLSAKDALGFKPSLNEDLLNIQENYFDNGDMFWIAIDDNDRVIGMIGTNTVSPTDMWLKRFFVKPSIKRNGLGSALLLKAEGFAKSKGIKTIHTQFNDNYIEASKFYAAKGFIEYQQSNGMNHLVKNVN